MSEEKCCMVCGKNPTQKIRFCRCKYEDREGYICSKHYYQLKRYGRFLDDNMRTRNDPNNYFIIENVAWVITVDKQQNETGRFKIDVEDLERVLTKKWHLDRSNNRYRTFDGSRHIDISTFILNKTGQGFDKMVDHINRDPSDNRKCNLRIVTPTENAQNKGVRKNKNVPITGVCFCKKRKNYMAYITYNKKTIRLGHFDYCSAVYARYYSEFLLFKEYRSTATDSLIQKTIQQCTNKEEIRQQVKDRIDKALGLAEKIA